MGRFLASRAWNLWMIFMTLVLKNPPPFWGWAVGFELILKMNLRSLRTMERRQEERVQVGVKLEAMNPNLNLKLKFLALPVTWNLHDWPLSACIANQSSRCTLHNVLTFKLTSRYGELDHVWSSNVTLRLRLKCSPVGKVCGVLYYLIVEI